MTIYLIRHGKTEANEKHLYCGSTDLPLSEIGKAELQALHYDIKNVRFITSGMKRTNETLRILFGDVPYVEDPRFREVDFGIFEMRSYDELKDTSDYQAWLAGDNSANIPPKGESGAQMKVRVLAAFSEIREDTCIITHGGVIAAIMEQLFPEDNKNIYQWQPKPGCGYAVEQRNYRML
ncbi:MAG: histidine phosphatase family protein [Oscillospiraceae bacterium]|nr:histidine phosphatase family protein [Oscillospiraceae bacterium]